MATFGASPRQDTKQCLRALPCHTYPVILFLLRQSCRTNCSRVLPDIRHSEPVQSMSLSLVKRCQVWKITNGNDY